MSDDDRTKILRRGGVGRPTQSDATVITPRPGVSDYEDPDKTRKIAQDDEATAKIPDRVRPVAPPPPQASDDITRLHRPGRTPEPAPVAKDSMDDPVVGWLVIIKGPGAGNAVRLGNYMNHIGRDSTNRVVLNFGDDEISRTAHAILTYDQRNRKYFIQGGNSGMNPTYVGEAIVLMPLELKGGEHIQIGNTTLAFTPFCGTQFDWSDLATP